MPVTDVTADISTATVVARFIVLTFAAVTAASVMVIESALPVEARVANSVLDPPLIVAVAPADVTGEVPSSRTLILPTVAVPVTVIGSSAIPLILPLLQLHQHYHIQL